MNLTDLQRVLTSVGVSPRELALGGRADTAWCIERTADDAWEVYWLERGNKNNLVHLASEADACHQLLGRLAYSQLLSGAIGPR